MTDTELTELREAARTWFVVECPPLVDHLVARAAIPSQWQAMCTMGWSGAIQPERAGGSGMGLSAMSVLLEESGRNLLTVPLLDCGLLAPVALANADGALASRIAKGEVIAALAHAEGAHASNALRTSARRSDTGWHVTGEKRFVVTGALADVLLVTAILPEGEPGLFRVDRGSFSMRPLNTVDGRAMADVTVDAHVPDSALIASGNACLRIVDLARLGVASELLGAARSGLALTVDYLKTRVQFGRPIGSFQALQHRAAQMLVEIELSAAATSAAWQVAEAGGELVGPVALARHMTGETAALVAREGIQMHGGIGMTAEHLAGRYLKWVEVSRKLYGSDAWLVDRWADAAGF